MQLLEFQLLCVIYTTLKVLICEHPDLGFDPLLDVVSVTAAGFWPFGGGFEVDQLDHLLIVQGRFPKAAPGKLVASDDLNQMFYAMCLDESMIVASFSKAEVLAAAKRAKNPGGNVPTNLRGLLKKVERNAHAWFIGSGKAVQSHPDAVVSLSIVPGKEPTCVIKAALDCSDREDAQRLALFAGFVRAWLHADAKNHKLDGETAAVFEVRQQGPTVQCDLRLSHEYLAILLGRGWSFVP